MTAAASPSAIDAVADALRDGLRDIDGRGVVNEDVTKHSLIWPVLVALGYPATHRIPEHEIRRDRPDDTCYLQPVNDNPGYAAVIVEAKEIGVDFDKRPPGRARSESPDRQIQRYLKQHGASGPDTVGVLTDGVKWRIYRRAGSAAQPDAWFVAEWDFRRLAESGGAALPELAPSLREQLAELVARLSRESLAAAAPQPSPAAPENRADRLFAAMRDNPQPESVLRSLLGETSALIQSDLAADSNLQGVRRDAHDNDWESYAYARTVAIHSDAPSMFDKGGVLAVVRHVCDPEEGLNRPETALCARAFAAAAPRNASATLAYTVSDDGDIEARLAIAAAGRVNMTAAFNPAMPTPSARAAIDRLLLRLEQPGDGLAPAQLLEPLEVAPLRQQFYKEVAQWTGRLQKGKDLSQRQAVLRHLVRVMFVWILKEENIVPPELFEQAFANASLPDPGAYHREILRFLFYQRLDTPEEQRDDHPLPPVNAAMDRAPFLNGSLFAERQDDDDLDIPAAGYWSAGEDEPGLFTILSRYHWTMDEHRPGESEQTLDPELLSNLFERLIAPTEEGAEPQLRQPKGTYYTPADVADEMVKDALAAAVRGYAPRKVSEAQLLALFGDADAPPPSLSVPQRRKLANRIRELRIFDPAVGSGEFLFRALLALQRALDKLEPDTANPVAEIIRRQLFGQDIHPLAVQITRLRLFVAIAAARRHDPDDRPLPNLEARIVCADTLETNASPDWRPGRPAQLDAADPDLVLTLTNAAENRAFWFDAHTEADKQALLKRDGELRDRLNLLLQQKGQLASPELIAFAQSSLFNLDPIPSAADARLLFYENPWRGFDIVIGNPPYEALSKSMDAAGRRRLSREKGYQTTNAGDLYTLFCETALALANPKGGVVTLIVPLSIAFGQSQKALRSIFNGRCREINLRHYDIRPDTPFNASPTVKTPENSQRATICTAVLGATRNVVVKSSGLQRWSAEERGLCLAQRTATKCPSFKRNVDSRLAEQWPRIPTPAVADMVEAILAQKKSVEDYISDSGERIAFPQTTRYFISSIPEGAVSPRSETLYTVGDVDTLRLIMAALNGHVAYGWWWVFGDAFHLKPYDLASLTIPDAWAKEPQAAIDLGQRLIDAMPDCTVEMLNRGTVWRNVNFHLKPELIAELDKLHIRALGLAEEPLLAHLRTMRSSSSWDYGG